MNRERTLEEIRNHPEVPVLIVGGGINGAGLLRELALQGIDALLVEKSDFCAGASSASTRIIHGGLRYLENGEFRLVRESLKERNRLLKTAPHYVRPLGTIIPISSWVRGFFPAVGRFFGIDAAPADRGALLFKIGLTLYDLLAGVEHVLPSHQFKSRAASLALRPHLNPRIVCTAVYYDAWISHPERLCLELLLDAEQMHPGARAANYVRLQHAARDVVTLIDELSGELLEVRPAVVVNATGAWIDLTNEAMKRETHYIGGTKGSHIVLDHPELCETARGQMIYFSNVDGRICLLVPFFDKVIAGSTDIRVRDPETACCDDDEVDYILRSVSMVVPGIKVNRSHIVFRFCGVRPLPQVDETSPGRITRDHTCAFLAAGDKIDFPIYSLIGGKWTTFRAFAEQVTDFLLPALRRSRRRRSAELAIGGGKGYPQTVASRKAWLATLQAKTALPQERLEVLLERYGTRAEALAEFIAAGSDRPLRYNPEYSRREIMFIAAHERVEHLDDLFLRRTLMAILGQLSLALLEELAATVAPILRWSSERTKAEVERAIQLLERVHGVTAEQLRRAQAQETREAKT